MIIGYARFIAKGGDIEHQMKDARSASKGYSCDRHFFEAATEGPRPQLSQILAMKRAGDVLVIPSLRHLGRTFKELMETLAWLRGAGLPFVVADCPIDLTGHAREHISDTLQAVANAFTQLSSEQAHRGRRALPREGNKGGRPRKINEQRYAEAVSFMRENAATSADAARELRLSISELDDWLRLEPPGNRNADRPGRVQPTEILRLNSSKTTELLRKVRAHSKPPFKDVRATSSRASKPHVKSTKGNREHRGRSPYPK